MKNRRSFLKTSSLAGAGMLLSYSGKDSRTDAATAAPLDPVTLTKFLDPVPKPKKLYGLYHEIAVSEFYQKLHSQLPPTLLWGYNGAYPGPTIEATQFLPTQVKWVNKLVNPALLARIPIDQTLHWANPLNQNFAHQPTAPLYAGPVPMVVHLHGGQTASDSDGHPDAWFTADYKIKGKAWSRPIYQYHNFQPPATLWYHDHVLGMTRLNVYAGMAGFYLLRNPFELLLNLPKGDYERELVIQDRIFDVVGQLVYPAAPAGSEPPYWIPEFMGDTILVNGKVWPYMNVEPRKYRFRLLNGSNARFYRMKLSNGLPFIQIGTDGGYLEKPVTVNTLTLAPGERADVIVNFKGCGVGTKFLLTNDAPGPFPNGDPADPDTVGQIIQFRIVPLTGYDKSEIPKTLGDTPRIATPSTKTRTLTLSEMLDAGTHSGLLLDGKAWHYPISELPKLGSTEIWQIVNLTADTHPIHLHLVNFLLLDRQQFDVNKYLDAYNRQNPVLPSPTAVSLSVTPYLTSAPIPPRPEEKGWKDTIQMQPGEVTRIQVSFAPNGCANYPFDPTTGPGYVWHCHMLEHEDNDMMRPFKVMR